MDGDWIMSGRLLSLDLVGTKFKYAGFKAKILLISQFPIKLSQLICAPNDDLRNNSQDTHLHIVSGTFYYIRIHSAFNK